MSLINFVKNNLKGGKPISVKMKTRIIFLYWDNERELFETNARDKQIQKVINDLREKIPDDYSTDDFVKGIKSLGLFIKRINETKGFYF
jgi:hypothetical protein